MADPLPTQGQNFFERYWNLIPTWGQYAIIAGVILLILAFLYFQFYAGARTRTGGPQQIAGARAESMTEALTIIFEGIANMFIRIIRFMWVRFKLTGVLIGTVIVIILIALAYAYFSLGSWNPIDGLLLMWEDLKSLF